MAFKMKGMAFKQMDEVGSNPDITAGPIKNPVGPLSPDAKREKENMKRELDNQIEEIEQDIRDRRPGYNTTLKKTLQQLINKRKQLI